MQNTFLLSGLLYSLEKEGFMFLFTGRYLPTTWNKFRPGVKAGSLKRVYRAIPARSCPFGMKLKWTWRQPYKNMYALVSGHEIGDFVLVHAGFALHVRKG
jgi:hypothetical protein